MISLPIDEMLSDLRAVLENFEVEQSDENIDSVYQELRRIEYHCENELDAQD